TDGQAVAAPELAPKARTEAELAWRHVGSAARGALHVGQQVALGRLDAGVGAGKYVADAAAGRQADVPDPAGGLRRGKGLRGDGRALSIRTRLRVRHLHRQRRVVEQNLLLRDEGDTVMVA